MPNQGVSTNESDPITRTQPTESIRREGGPRNPDTVTMTAEELNDRLQEAAAQGAKEAADRMKNLYGETLDVLSENMQTVMKIETENVKNQLNNFRNRVRRVFRPTQEEKDNAYEQQIYNWAQEYIKTTTGERELNVSSYKKFQQQVGESGGVDEITIGGKKLVSTNTKDKRVMDQIRARANEMARKKALGVEDAPEFRGDLGDLIKGQKKAERLREKLNADVDQEASPLTDAVRIISQRPLTNEGQSVSQEEMSQREKTIVQERDGLRDVVNKLSTELMGAQNKITELQMELDKKKKNEENTGTSSNDKTDNENVPEQQPAQDAGKPPAQETDNQPEIPEEENVVKTSDIMEKINEPEISQPTPQTGVPEPVVESVADLTTEKTLENPLKQEYTEHQYYDEKDLKSIENLQNGYNFNFKTYLNKAFDRLNKHFLIEMQNDMEAGVGLPGQIATEVIDSFEGPKVKLQSGEEREQFPWLLASEESPFYNKEEAEKNNQDVQARTTFYRLLTKALRNQPQPLNPTMQEQP